MTTFTIYSSWDKLIDYCKANIAHCTVEEFHLLFLDRKNTLIRHERQQRGTIDHTPVYPREVVKRALELNPSYALAHSGYAGVLSNMGRHRDAIAEAMQARELDPVSVSSNTALARILYRARRYDESIAAARKAVELEPTDASPLWWIALCQEQKVN